MANQTPDLKVRYEFDQTGQSPNNLVSNEQHTTTQRLRKIIVPHYGHFYNNSVVLTELPSGREVPRTDYFFEDPSEVIALKTGLAASMVIVVTNSSLGNKFAVTYQAVGGEYSGANVKLLAQKLQDLNHDNRPVEWENIRNKPTTFNPADHKHPIYQTFGYEGLIYIIERYIRAVLVGDEASHDVIWDELKKIRQLINSTITPVVNDFNNYKISQAEALRLLKEKVTQLGTSSESKVSELNDKLEQHKRASNPHNITPGLIGAPTSQQMTEGIESLRRELKTLIAAQPTKEQVNLEISSLKNALNQLRDSGLNKASRAADTTLFVGKTYEAVKTEISDKALEDHKDDFVHMGTGVGQIRATGTGNNLTNVVKIGKDASNKLVKVSVDNDDYGTVYNYRGDSTQNLNSLNRLEHIGIWKVAQNTTSAPIIHSGTLLVVPSSLGVMQIFYPSSGDNNDSENIYRRFSTSNNTFTEWKKIADYRDAISHEKSGTNQSKIASEKALGDLNRELTNAINNGIKNTLKENILKYVDGQTTLDRQAINKALFGKPYNLGIGSAAVVNREFANLNVDSNQVTRRITELFGTEQPKLAREVIPISSVESNLIRWNNDGLYYGNVPDELTKNLYVDPTDGVDEPITETNGRGTRNKPLATLAYALAQGPANVDRTIYLAEGKEHKVGRKATAIRASGITYENTPQNHATNDVAYIRGGRVVIDIYGPRIDAIYNDFQSSRDHTDSFIAEDRTKALKVKNISTRLVFQGIRLDGDVYIDVDGRRALRKALNMTCLEFIGVSDVVFKNMTLVNYTTTLLSPLIADQEKYTVSEEARFSRSQSANISFNNCCFDTGREYRINDGFGEVFVSTFMETSEHYKNLSLYNNRLESDFVWGEGAIILYRSNNSAVLAREGVSLPSFFEISNGGEKLSTSSGVRPNYFRGMKIGNGQYLNVRTNFYPSEEASLKEWKRIGSTVNTQKADIEIDSDGKIYCIHYNRTSNRIERIQIHPPRWVR